MPLSRTIAIAAAPLALAAALLAASAARATVPTPVPKEQRGRLDAERAGTHDASNIRTIFWNYGMVGDYPSDPIGVDLTVFHSGEVPKGSGMNYSDGITPFVLAKIKQGAAAGGDSTYIMETGYRERQALSPYFNRVMRFEPRPGYFQADPRINKGRSPAISNDARTWPSSWPDRLDDITDPGWAGAWNGYFGKRPAADQESYTVMDDDFYDAWLYHPDSRDSTRKGLGLRVEVRGFQWANPQAGNVIFWHYDITNESTTDYDKNIVFGLYMDSGVGGSTISCDRVAESDDDNAFYDPSRLNLVYTWDNKGHGVDLAGDCSRTGYLGYAYLETPGNPFDGSDNDKDGVTDERRDSGPGERIEGKVAIEAYVRAHYTLAAFEDTYGPLTNRPAYKAGVWWTGDEDMDWIADLHDTGEDGVFDTHDVGELDGRPTAGEANFDKTDLNESDQIGLTGFKMNRIKAAQDNPNQAVDGVIFYEGDNTNWPARLYAQFNDPNPANRFDPPLASNYNIGFLFASGPFTLKAGQTERFSLALAYGADLTELRSTVNTVQQIYNANYQFAVPPALPTVHADAGDHRVTLSWDEVAERSIDPVTYTQDFEGYRIYRSTDPEFRDPQVVSTGRGTGPFGNGKPIAQFDNVDGKRGYSRIAVQGVQYWLGDETGITHTWTDTTVVNGQEYYYAVCAYDYGFDTGSDSTSFYPSENAISVSRTPRGGVILPTNVVVVRPNPRVPGYLEATAGAPTHTSGRGVGTVDMRVVTSSQVPDGHVFRLTFAAPAPESLRATTYSLTDSTTGTLLFKGGHDLEGRGIGPVGGGILPVITSPPSVEVDAATTGWAGGSSHTPRLRVTYQPVLDRNYRRPNYPEDFSIIFDNVVRDTSLAIFPRAPLPMKFQVIAHPPVGDVQLDFRVAESSSGPAKDSTLSKVGESIDIVTYDPLAPGSPAVTWRVEFDPSMGDTIVKLGLGDRYDVHLTRPFGADDVFTFRTSGATVAGAKASADWAEKPYVVPNPYVGSASFEPARFAVSGRGDRRIEFRAIPQAATVRLYTVRGQLVQTLTQNGSFEGFIPWDLRTKDNLDAAPGLYIYQVEAPGLGTYTGKFAIIK